MVAKILFWIGIVILAFILLFIFCAMKLSSICSRMEEVKEYAKENGYDLDNDKNSDDEIDC